MAWICADPDYALEDVKKDRRGARFIEKYGFSEKAVYDGGKYLPFCRILSVRLQSSFYYPGHCCGNAKKAISMIRAANPEVVMEEIQTL